MSSCNDLIMWERLDGLRDYAPITVRLGVSAVFLWFGVNQLLFPANFIGYLPQFLFDSAFATQAVLLNGAFEVVFGLALVIGFFTRWVALLLGLHLFGITLTLGYGEIAVRDFGLTLATLSIFLWGDDKWCLDYRRKQKKEKSNTTI